MTAKFILHVNFLECIKAILTENASKKKWSQLSDDACGEPERSEGNRPQVNGLPLTCVKKRKPKNRNLLQIFTGLIFLQAKKWSQLSESTRRAKPDEVPERSARHKLISEEPERNKVK